MDTAESLKPRRFTLGPRGIVPMMVVYLVGTTLALFFLLSQRFYDDPFITYRYAQNLANGNGFVYNPGEQVLSTTTPLFAILLALGTRFTFDLPMLANLIGVLSLAAGALFLWDLANVWKTPQVGWAALLLYPTFTLALTTLGSETPLYLALCLGAFASYARQRYILTAICAGSAVLARPDGLLIPVILAIHFMVQSLRAGNLRAKLREQKWAVAVFLLPLVIWLAFSWPYFGSPLPVTLPAKQSQASMAISQRFAPGFIRILGWYNKWPYWLEAGLAIFGLIWIVLGRRQWLLFVTLLFENSRKQFIDCSSTKIWRYKNGHVSNSFKLRAKPRSR